MNSERSIGVSEPDGGSAELLTKAQLADRLHKSPRCVEIWMRRHYLPYVKIGRSVLFHWPDVLRSLKRFEVR